MSKYYILSLDSFSNAFSIIDGKKNVLFSMKLQGSDDITSDIETGDKILIYNRKPSCIISMLFCVESTSDKGIILRKELEVCDGTSERAGINVDLENTDLINITEEQYHIIVNAMLHSLQNDTTPIKQDVPRLTGAENVLLYGVPGAGKSHKIATEYCSDHNYIERVVFHPDYTYSDFVGQILPRVKGKDLTYEFTPGPFTAILKKAVADPGNMYYLVVEEINRGNAPAIFGEIFQLLDRKDEDGYSADEIGESEYGIVNYDVAKEVYGNPEHFVKIPSNLTILATMNTADQNVFTLDTAFQRRWNMEHIENDVSSAKHSNVKIENTDVTWGAFAAVINDIIVETSFETATSADKRLGAYFVKERELVQDKFPEKVLKYLWDDAFKMDHDLVFRDDIASLEGVISTYTQAEPDKLKAVLRLDVYQKMLQGLTQKPSDNGDENNE